MEKKGTPASPATALAIRVFPVPGGPTRITPLGMRAPTSVYFWGFRRKSTISSRSCFSSTRPATSPKVTFSSSSVVIRARLFPKFIIWALAPPPACRFIRKKNTKIRSAISSIGSTVVRNTLCAGTSPTITGTSGSASRISSWIRLTSETAKLPWVPSFRCTATRPVGTWVFCRISTETTSPCSSASERADSL